MPAQAPSHIIALDVGERRIGVAIASLEARLPSPHGVIINSVDVLDDIQHLVVKEAAMAVVVGLPRGLDGQETAQTKTVREFANSLKDKLDIPVHFQDEALTSKLAEQELKDRGVGYNKEDVDALAATYILKDFLETHEVL
ncbi:MAG TPA: Holliday junction resolvase RuvX [Patescibacteria group bacterium]|nr:Holliday junction resolvase RuvX [Patescibacteria group bacterium]